MNIAGLIGRTVRVGMHDPGNNEPVAWDWEGKVAGGAVVLGQVTLFIERPSKKWPGMMDIQPFLMDALHLCADVPVPADPSDKVFEQAKREIQLGKFTPL